MNRLKKKIVGASDKTVMGLKKTVETVTSAADALTPDLLKFGQSSNEFALLDDKELCRLLMEFEQHHGHGSSSSKETGENDGHHHGQEDAETAARREKAIVGEDNLVFLESLIEKSANDSFDPIENMLDHLPEHVADLDPTIFDMEERRHELLLDVVMKRLATTVVSNSGAFVEGLKQVQELEADVNLTNFICKKGRRHLGQAEEELRSGGLVILAKFKKKQLSQEVMVLLTRLKELHDKKKQFLEMLQIGEYDLASEISNDCLKSASSLDGVECAVSLRQSILQVDRELESRMEASIVQLCLQFKDQEYSQLLKGYERLGQLSSLAGKLVSQLSQTITKSLQDIAFSFAVAGATAKVSVEAMKGMHYDELVVFIPDQNFWPCLLQSLEMLTDIIISVTNMIKYHDDRIVISSDSGKEDIMGSISFKLENSRTELWSLMQKRMCSLLGAPKCTSWKLHKFLQVVHAVQQFVVIGEEFSQGDTNPLKGSIRMQSKSYYEAFHRDHIMLVTNQLENELWHRFPCDKKFSIWSIRELQGFSETHGSDLPITVAAGSSRNVLISLINEGNPFRNMQNQAKVPPAATASTSPASSTSDKKDLSLKSKIPHHNSNNNNHHDDDDDDDDDEDGELAQDFVDEEERTSSSSSKAKKPATSSSSSDTNIMASGSKIVGPVFTSTALSLIKFIGSYIQMMEVLQPVAHDAFAGIEELYQFYVVTVIDLFTPPIETPPPTTHSITASSFTSLTLSSSTLSSAASAAAANQANQAGFAAMEQDSNRMSARLRSTLRDMKDRFHSEANARFPRVKLNSSVDIKSPQSCMGLSHRYCAIESLIFMAEVMQQLKPKISGLIPPKAVAVMNKFFLNTIECSTEVRDAIYRRLPLILMPMDSVLAMMDKVKWDTKEIGAYHNAYIDEICKRFQQLQGMMHAVSAEISQSALDLVIVSVIVHAMDQLVEGFSRVKKCSNEGRAMMSHDLETLSKALEKFTSVRPIPHVRHVDEYIKAYYMPEQDVISWVHQHPEYSQDQIINVIKGGVGLNMKRKARDALIANVEATLRASGV